jgi:hypothetical protein
MNIARTVVHWAEITAMGAIFTIRALPRPRAA